MKEQIKTFLYSTTASFSSLLFGLLFTSEQVLYPKLEENFSTYNLAISFDNYKNMFAYSVFLGAFFISCLNYIFTGIDRKTVLILNNITYLIACLLSLVSSDICVSLCARLIIGIGAGNSCCIVPNYLFSVTNDDNRGFYMSFHSIGIVFGLVLGKLLQYIYGTDGWRFIYLSVTCFIVIHTIALCFIRNCPYVTSENDHTTITELLKNKKARKSVFLSLCFHISQHACGIEFFTNFLEAIFDKSSNIELQSVLTLAFSAFVSIISSLFIDKVGRKKFIIISTVIIIFCTLYINFIDMTPLITYVYMFGYNIGIASIPWFITNEIFEPKYVMPAMRLSIGANWLSAFFLSILSFYLHDKIGNTLFLLYGGVMTIFLMIVIVFFKETKNRPIGFQ
ncbi:solute carrier family 2, facilitated glucose transporter member 3 [Vairimorpha necatrix]|uniref:Solute carrier family 2, facilitated glucose transporter member 3 n=1 Tax=Vairimorpha necatrix TaxID=6039 RepID=A0AAX4JCX3_9MICR